MFVVKNIFIRVENNINIIDGKEEREGEGKNIVYYRKSVVK